MTSEPVTYPGYRFPAVLIHHAIWLYHVLSRSLRDVELILAERGVVVTHESIRQWCRTFGAGVARRLRKRRPQPGDTWHMDEVFIRRDGTQHDLWRAVDQNRGRARHPGAGAPQRRGRQALLQAPACRAQIQAEAHHHRSE